VIDFVVVIVEIEIYELAAVQSEHRRTKKVSYFRDVTDHRRPEKVSYFGDF
jgi:hypothetical protein